MIAARDNFTQSLFLDISHNKLSCHIKILSVLAQEQQKLESDILYPINVFSGPLTISSKKEWFKTKILSPFFFIFVKNLWRLNCTLNTIKTTYTGFQFSACKTKMDLLSKTIHKCTSLRGAVLLIKLMQS